MKKLNDYSGPSVDNLKLEDFSKEFLIKLAREWQATALRWEEQWHKMIEEGLGKKESDRWEADFWVNSAKVTLTRMAKVANVEVKDVMDYLKVGQLVIEGSMGFQPSTTLQTVNGNRNHVVWTAKRCLNLEYFEKYDSSRIMPVCHSLEEFSLLNYGRVYFPDLKVKPLKLPPRKSRDEIACQWEIWVP